MTQDNPPKPPARPDKVSLWQYIKLFRRDILSAQPARLYRGWMAEFRAPFFRSYLINEPPLIRTVLNERAQDFPKSERLGAALRPLLGNGVFLANGEEWKRQRRIIDPAFEGGRLRDTFPGIVAAGNAAVDRLAAMADSGQPQEVEAMSSHIAADVIFRTLFSIPIESEIAQVIFEEFRAYQRAQPLISAASLLPVPLWLPKIFRRGSARHAHNIRTQIATVVAERLAMIEAGEAPDDLSTKILTTTDPVTGDRFTLTEMVDQVAIFFLAGHETGASALAWALYLLARYPEWQDKVAAEAAQFTEDFADLSKLRITRDVFRETMRLYPPVPMSMRQTAGENRFRNRDIPKGSQIVVSHWHLHRHERLWDNPDGFDPARWTTETCKKSARDAYLPFSSGPRVCIGAGFAMIEGTVLLAQLVRDYRWSLVAGAAPPVPAAQLTTRAMDGIHLVVSRRNRRSNT